MVTGALGLVWVALWAAFYQSPDRHPRLGPAERALILADRPAGRPWWSPPQVPVRRLLAMRETWGCILARVLTDPISYFLNFWIPQYLQDERGFTLADLAKFGWIPFVALALGNLAAGAIPRALIARGWSLDRARKAHHAGRLAGHAAAVPVGDPGARPGAWRWRLVALVMFGHAAWGNIILPAELFPARVVATVSGLGGALGAAAGALTQLGVGKVVQAFSFKPVFAVCSGMYLLGLLLVTLLCRDLGRIRQVDQQPVDK